MAMVPDSSLGFFKFYINGAVELGEMAGHSLKTTIEHPLVLSAFGQECVLHHQQDQGFELKIQATNAKLDSESVELK